MDTAIVTTYCLVDDWLRARRHQESPQRSVSDAEVMTAAITAARFFGGNFEDGLDLLAEKRYFGHRLMGSSPRAVSIGDFTGWLPFWNRFSNGLGESIKKPVPKTYF